jgi:hypothetical protein
MTMKLHAEGGLVGPRPGSPVLRRDADAFKSALPARRREGVAWNVKRETENGHCEVLSCCCMATQLTPAAGAVGQVTRTV